MISKHSRRASSCFLSSLGLTGLPCFRSHEFMVSKCTRLTVGGCALPDERAMLAKSHEAQAFSIGMTVEGGGLRKNFLELYRCSCRPNAALPSLSDSKNTNVASLVSCGLKKVQTAQAYRAILHLHFQEMLCRECGHRRRKQKTRELHSGYSADVCCQQPSQRWSNIGRASKCDNILQWYKVTPYRTLSNQFNTHIPTTVLAI